MFQRHLQFASGNSGVTQFILNPRCVPVRPQGHDSAEDTPHAGPIIGDKQSVSPLAGLVTNLDLLTSERTIIESAPTQPPPASTNVATTQPPASRTPIVCRSSIPSPEHTHETHPFTLQYAVLEDVAFVNTNLGVPRFELYSFFIFTPNTQNTYHILDLISFWSHEFSVWE